MLFNTILLGTVSYDCLLPIWYRIWKKGQVENSVLLVVAAPTVARSLCNVWTPKNRPNPTLSLRTFLSGGKKRWDWKNSAIVENMWVFF